MVYRSGLFVTTLLVATASLAVAWAGGQHGGTAGGMPTPCGDSGCGPRYRGAIHEEPARPDPCDACGRWLGCDGSRPAAELLAPWQLPPGRGFTRPGDLGYTRPIGVCGEGQPCHDCEPGRGCGGKPPWRPLWWF